MWLNLQFPADLVTFTEEILNKKLQFFCSVIFRRESRLRDSLVIKIRVLEEFLSKQFLLYEVKKATTQGY